MPSQHESLINRLYYLNLESSLRVQFSNIFIQEIKSSGATVGLREGFQARNYIYMKGKPFLSKTLCKIDKVLKLGDSILI